MSGPAEISSSTRTAGDTVRRRRAVRQKEFLQTSRFLQDNRECSQPVTIRTRRSKCQELKSGSEGDSHERVAVHDERGWAVRGA